MSSFAHMPAEHLNDPAEKHGSSLKLKDVERLLNLRLELLGRVESLSHVSIAKVPYLTSAGDMISLPGPWSIEVPSIASTAVSVIASPSNLEESDEASDDIESISDCSEIPLTALDSSIALVREQRSSSSATTASAVSISESLSPDSSVVSRFVVRNEFGHVRIQPLIELVEMLQERGRTSRSEAKIEAQLRVGGHIVLPPSDFAACIEAGMGEQHPFAGRYHPIAGNVVPETTLLFYGPRTEEELEVVWDLIRKSFDWVYQSCQ